MTAEETNLNVKESSETKFLDFLFISLRKLQFNPVQQSALFIAGPSASQVRLFSKDIIAYGRLSSFFQVIAGTDSIDCDIDAPYAGYSIINGIEYLRSLDGQPVARAGECNRVSCFYGGGIYVCSDVRTQCRAKSYCVGYCLVH